MKLRMHSPKTVSIRFVGSSNNNFAFRYVRTTHCCKYQQLLDILPGIITFGIAACNTINVATLFCGVTGIINTLQSVVPCTATKL